MMQSRTMSFIEAATNVVVGFGLAVLTQVLVFPVFGIAVSFDQHVSIAVIFTLVSLARGYVLRRVFNALALPPNVRHTLCHDRTAAEELADS